MNDNLLLRLAHRRVHSFADEVICRHEEAMECWDCQEWLQKGIDAYKWLRRAEETLREADYEGIYCFSAEVQSALDTLYRAWLTPCEQTEQWARELLNRGCEIDNLGAFVRVCDEVRDLIARRDWKNRAKNARVLAQSEESW